MCSRRLRVATHACKFATISGEPPLIAAACHAPVSPAPGMGLTLTFNDFREVLATPGRIFAGFALQYTIMPLMAFAVSRLMGLPLAYTIG